MTTKEENVAMRAEIAGALNVAQESEAVDVTYVLLQVQGLIPVAAGGGAPNRGAGNTSPDVASAPPTTAVPPATTGQRAVDTYNSVRAEIAGALGVDDSDPLVDEAYVKIVVDAKTAQEAARIAEAEAIFEAIKTHGRRVQEYKVDFGDDISMARYVEFVPLLDAQSFADVAMRTVVDTATHGVLGDTIARRSVYRGSRQELLGTVLSEIDRNNVETVTKVNQEFPGAIALKPGDTRTVPAPTTTAAGTVPSSWDPQPDGRYGSTRPKADADDAPGDQQPADDGRQDDQGPTADEPAADTTTSWIRYDADGKVVARGTETLHADGRVTVTTTEGVATGSVTYASKEEQAKHENTAGAGSVTTGDQTKVDVEKSDDDEADDASTNENDDDHVANDGYSDTSLAPGGLKVTVAPADFGDSNDANAIELPLGEEVIARVTGMDPNVTDPAGPDEGEEVVAGSTVLKRDMTKSLRDYGNPLDAGLHDAPPPDIPTTGEAERVGSDDERLPGRRPRRSP